MNNGKFSKEMTDKIAKYVSLGLTNLQACNCCDIDEKTFYNWMKQHSSFSSAIKKARDVGEASNLAIIHKAKERSWQAAAWLLERQHKDTYALTQNLNVSGNVKSTNTVHIDLDKKSKEVLEAKLDAILRAPKDK